MSWGRIAGACSLAGALVWLVLGCETEGTCAGGASSQTPTLMVEPAPLDDPGNDGITLRGSVTSDRRVESIVVHSIAATSGEENYQTWSATIPNALLRDRRRGRHAILEVKATDGCGATDCQAVSVPITARPGTNAKGLAVVTFEAPNNGCSLPADGTSPASVTISADSSAVGVPVTVSVPAGLQVQGAADAKWVLDCAEPSDAPPLKCGTDEAANGSDLCAEDAAAEVKLTLSVQSAAMAPPSATLIAQAGPSTASPEKPLVIAEAPQFSGASGSIPRGRTFSVTVATKDKFELCTVSSAIAGSSQVSLSASSGLSEEMREALLENLRPLTPDMSDPADPSGDVDSCGQSVTFEAVFPATAPVGATLTFICEDLHGQTSTHTVTADATIVSTVSSLSSLAADLGNERCTLPADGSASASITVTSTLDAVGNSVAVGVAPANTAELLGVDTGRVTLVASDDAATATFAVRSIVRTDGSLTVSASVPADILIIDPPISVAAAPAFTSAKASIPVGSSEVIWVETRDRIERCSLKFAGTGLATVTAEVVGLEDSSFALQPFTFPGDDGRPCGELWPIQIGLTEDAVSGAQLRISCEDSHGQVNTLALSAAKPVGAGGASSDE